MTQTQYEQISTLIISMDITAYPSTKVTGSKENHLSKWPIML